MENAAVIDRRYMVFGICGSEQAGLSGVAQDARAPEEERIGDWRRSSESHGSQGSNDLSAKARSGKK